MIASGDTVVCIREHYDSPRPGQKLKMIPQVGEVYTVTEVIPTWFGLGVKLEDMDHSPAINGYVLLVEAGKISPLGQRIPKDRAGWFFQKVEPVNIKQIAKNSQRTPEHV